MTCGASRLSGRLVAAARQPAAELQCLRRSFKWTLGTRYSRKPPEDIAPPARGSTAVLPATDMSDEIYTVGHSNHSGERFIELLRAHGVTAIADVRSTPYSRRNPQFNRNDLRATLKEHAIQYAFLGEELGARSDDECCYVNDKVQYALLAKTPLFQSGIERVMEGARSHKIALMCAEKDPLNCHRAILVARTLAQAGLSIMHILSDGSVETHDDALGRLIDRLGLGHEDLFRSRTISVEEAYGRQGERIAFERAAPRATLNETEVQ